MELKELIESVLGQMSDLKSNADKKRYVVEEIEFELAFSATIDGKLKASLFNLSAAGGGSSKDAHSVRVKLKPKRPPRPIAPKSPEK